MNKTKILAFISLAAMLAACGSDDGAPPELAKSYPNSISPFDTLVVKFNSNLVDANESNMILNQGKWTKEKTSGNELRFIGTNATTGGWHYFDYGKHDSIVFKNLKNSDGYIKDRTVFYFYTLPILDKESNANEATANDIDLIGDIRNGEGILFAGILDSISGVTETGQEIPPDTRDYYTFKLKVADTVFATVENREPLSVAIKGPAGVADSTTFQAAKGKSNVFTYIFGTECLLEGSCSRDSTVSFYINAARVSSSPNPYTIRIKVTEYKQKQ